MKECFSTSNNTDNQLIHAKQLNRTEIVTNDRSVLDDNLSNQMNILNKSNTHKSNSHNKNNLLFNHN
jgi:hypothetical protein